MNKISDAWHTDSEDEAYWTSIREQFTGGEDEDYLNTGSFGILPRPVLDRLQQDLVALEKNPTRVRREYTSSLDGVRSELGRFLNVPGEDISLATNVTTAMNMVILGLEWNEGDEILASDQEYGAINNIMDYASKRFGVTVHRARIPKPPSGDDAVIAAFEESITEKTRLVVCSHIATNTGLILPIKEIAGLAHSRGAMLAVDGAHGPGMLPLDLTAMGCDFYGGNCHKWLCAPKGTGILYAHRERQHLLHPTQVSWGYQPEGPALKEGRLTIKDRPFMWELEVVGTRDLACYACIPEAIRFQRSIGRERILGRYRQLAGYVRRQLAATGWSEMVTPEDPSLSAGLSAFHLNGFKGIDLGNLLYDRYRITVRAEPVGDRHWMRISTHYCIGFEELDRLMAALMEIRPR